MRILIIEDEIRLSDVIKQSLVEANYAVDQAFDGDDGLFLAESENYDAIILDVMLPQLEGIEVARRLRANKISTPILMLTAKSQLDDKLTGLEAGADDYLTKPFELAELKARIHALLRRSHQQLEQVTAVGSLEFNTSQMQVKRNGKEIKLTPKEFAILEYLVRHHDQVVTRTQIIEHVWDYNFDSMSNVVDVFMANLRKKIDGPARQKLIHTIHGMGYKLSAEEI
jgi:DNA-binding response OmpR family regulator